MSSFKNNIESYSLSYILTILLWKSVLPLTFKNSSRHQKMSKNMLVLPNQSCIVWLDRIKQTGDEIMTNRPRSSTAASTRGCTSQICCAVNYEFTQSPIPINTYLHPINTCCLSVNKNHAWWLIHADGTISMLMEAASDVKVRRPTDTLDLSRSTYHVRHLLRFLFGQDLHLDVGVVELPSHLWKLPCRRKWHAEVTDAERSAFAHQEIF